MIHNTTHKTYKVTTVMHETSLSRPLYRRVRGAVADRSLGSIECITNNYLALAKKTSVLREAALSLFEAFEVRIAKCCKQR